jgi:hypothetical protein
VSPTTGEVLLRLWCRGHPAIRATHTKTLEFTAEADISDRATCVAGVGLRYGTPACPVLAGPVLLRMRAGTHEFTARALANPRWRPGEGLIVRRSGNRLPDTVATNADLSAADLPRDALALLRNPAQEIEVTVERGDGGQATLIFLALADDRERIRRARAESSAAGLVIAEDPTARALLAGNGLPALGRQDGGDAADEVIRSGGRVVVAACEALPGRTLLSWLEQPGDLVIEVTGLSPALAAAACSPSRDPVLLLDGATPRELRSAVRVAPPATRLVFRARPQDVPALCRVAAQMRPTGLVTVVSENPARAERVWRVPPDLISATLPARDSIMCCLDSAPSRAGPGDDQVRRFAAALARQGVPTRVLASALAGAPGWSRNRAYEFIRGAAASDREP